MRHLATKNGFVIIGELLDIIVRVWILCNQGTTKEDVRFINEVMLSAESSRVLLKLLLADTEKGVADPVRFRVSQSLSAWETQGKADLALILRE